MSKITELASASMPASGQVPNVDGLRKADVSADRRDEMQAKYIGIVDTLLVSSLGNVDAAIDYALSGMGALAEADRAYIHLTRQTQNGFVEEHEWCAEGMAPAIYDLENFALRLSLDSTWLKSFRAGEHVFVEDVATLPEGLPARRVLRARGVRSFLAVPIQQNGHFIGFLGFDYIRQPRRLPVDDLQLVLSIARIVYWVLNRHDGEARLCEAHDSAIASRNHLRSVLQAIPEMVVEVDRDGEVIDWHSDPRQIPDAIGRHEQDGLLPTSLTEDARQVLRDAARRLSRDGHLAGYKTRIGEGAAQRSYEISGTSVGGGGSALFLKDITEQTRQMPRLELLSDVARRTTNMVLVIGTDHCIEWANPAFEQLTGWRLDEIRGRRPQHVLHIRRRDGSDASLIDKVLSGDEAVQVEFQTNARDGREIWVALDAQPLRGHDGSARGFVVIGTDITDIRQQGKELARAAQSAASARATLEAAVESLQDGFILFDADDRLVICNQKYRDLDAEVAALLQPGTGFEQILRAYVQRGVFPDAVGQEEDWVRERLRLRQYPCSDTDMRTADGRWVRVCDKRTPDGGRVGLRIDITRLKLAEARAEADLITALDACHDGISFFDPDGQISYVNQSKVDLFGYAAPDDLLGQSWRVFYEPQVADWIEKNAQVKLFETGHWSGEVLALHRDGSPIQQDLSLTLKKDGHVLSISRDATARRHEEAERNRLREELNISRRREIIGQMAAGLAHDFSNVLATIAGGATLIESDSIPGSQIFFNARRLISSAVQAKALIQRLLRLDAGSTEPMLMDLRCPVAEAAELVRAGIRKQASLSVEIAETPLNMIVDPTDVLQVVLNLAMNANDALTGPTGDVAIRLHEATAADLEGPVLVGAITPAKRYFCLSVSDTGRGMSPEVIAQAFTPYFSTKGSDGTGLGLAVAASIMRANGGAIRLDSHEGIGSTCSTLWPADNCSDLSQFLDQDPGTHLEGSRIVVVNDQPDVLTLLAEILELAGAEVAPTGDVDLALEVLKEDPELWDMIIIDQAMEGAEGVPLSREIRKISLRVPILQIGGTNSAANPRPASCDVTIEKPVKPSLLVQVVGQNIRKSKP